MDCRSTHVFEDTIKVTDKYIKKAEKLLKDKLKNEPKWKKDIGTFGLSKHSESFSNDPKIKDLVEFIGQRSYEFLDWQGFNLQNIVYTLQNFGYKSLVKKVVVT